MTLPNYFSLSDSYMMSVFIKPDYFVYWKSLMYESALE